MILPHGVLFRGNAESTIRKNLVKQGYIKGIIGLPANLFYGTGIPACIIVLDKADAAKRTHIFMIDGSKGFMKDGNKNRLRSQDIHKIVDVFNKQIEIDRYSRFVPISEIADKNEYNLNIPRYIDSSEPEDLHDLTAHLNGGIPKADIDQLESYWQHLPAIRNELFKESGREGYLEAKHKADEIKAVVLEHKDFKSFANVSKSLFTAWVKEHSKSFYELSQGDNPKKFIFNISEDLLERFKEAPLLDKYDIYQHLMDYWADIMQDDVSLIIQDGWLNANKLRVIVEEKGKKSKETPDLIIAKKKYKADLIPPHLVVEKFFSSEKQTIDDLQTKADTAAQDFESFVDENSGEDSPLEDAKNDKDKITKALLTDEIKKLKSNGSADDLKLLQSCLKHLNSQASAEKVVKTAQKELDEKVYAKYPKITETEIKEIVIEHKWIATLGKSIDGEIERVISRMVERIKTLEERYNEPLPKIEADLVELSGMVEHHLRAMGVSW